jgi:DNA-binding MarR family transcriptional regulator
LSTSDSPLASAAIHKFLLIHRHLRQYARQIDSQGIGPRQLAVLRFLLENGPATVGDVQDYLYTSASTASTVISRLEESGHATRTRSDADNRVVIVELTPKGRDTAEHTPIGGIALLRRGLKTLPEGRLRQIDAVLAEIMQLMEVTENE